MVLTDSGTWVEVETSDPRDKEAVRSGMRIEATGRYQQRGGGRDNASQVFRAATMRASGGPQASPVREGGAPGLGGRGGLDTRVSAAACVTTGSVPPSLSPNPPHRQHSLPACPTACLQTWLVQPPQPV